MAGFQSGRDQLRATLCSHFVLDNQSQPRLYPCARSAPDEGRAREASQCGSRHGPVTGLANLSTGGPGCVPLNRDWSQAPADVAVPAWRSHRTGTACPPKKAVREEALPALPFTPYIIEPGCPSRHPRLPQKAWSRNGSGPARHAVSNPLLFDHSLLRGFAMTFPEPIPSVEPFPRKLFPLAWDHLSSSACRIL